MRILHDIVTSSFRRCRTRISFDIDDTLICHHGLGPPARGLFPEVIRRRFGEPLRQGTYALIRELRRRGCSIWIYTTSGRSPAYIRRWLLMHGIRVDGIINSERHHRDLTSQGYSRPPSKFPPAFGIDLHVDDSDGVGMEGETHGFQVVVVDPHDKQWTKQVLEAVIRAQAAIERRHTPRLAIDVSSGR